jgi:hypothetical protein
MKPSWKAFEDEDPYKFERDAGRHAFAVHQVRPTTGGERASEWRPDVAVFIDTGGSELLLDSEFARELNVKPMGSVRVHSAVASTRRLKVGASIHLHSAHGR